MASSTASIWERIDRALAQYAPAIGRTLQPPAADAALDEWLAELTTELPDLAASYAIHDGSAQAGGIFARLPRPAAASFAQATTWLSAAAAREAQKHLHGLGVRMMPIGEFVSRRRTPQHEEDPFEGESLQAVVLEPKTGLLFALNYHEYSKPPAQLVPLELTWAAYLETFAREVESGRFESFRDEFQVLRLVEKTSTAAPPAAPRNDATVLLAMLRERGLIELAEKPSSALRAEIAKALRRRSAEKRLEGLRKALDEYDEVIEDYSTDEELAALIAVVRGAP